MRYSARSAALAAALAGLGLCQRQRHGLGNGLVQRFHPRPFHGISLSREGRLSLAPKVETVFTSDQPVIWSVAEAPDGTLYAAPAIADACTASAATAKARCCGPPISPRCSPRGGPHDGAVYAGTSPDGKVYRIERQGRGILRAQRALHLVAGGGARWRAVRGHGRPGQGLPRNRSAGKGELYYDTGQSHITGLAVDARAGCWPAPSPTASSIAFPPRTRPSCCTMPACRKSAPSFPCRMARCTRPRWAARWPNGRRRRAGRAGLAGGAGPATATTTITVEANTGPGEIKPPEPAKPQSQSAAPVSTPQVSTQFTPVVDLSGVDKSAVYRINPDNTVETLWSSKEENVYDLLALEKQILFSTDNNGRIYGLAPDRRVTLVTQTNEGETTRLLPSDHSVLAATSNMGRIFRLGETPGASGSYEAPVHDSGTASRWGSLNWRADAPAGCTVRFRTRSGNSAKPDRTWSDWSEPLTDAPDRASPAPTRATSNGRRNWRAGRGHASAQQRHLAYLPQNSPPVVKSINVVMQSVALADRQAGSHFAFVGLQRYGERHRGRQHRGPRRHAHADAAARRFAADHGGLAGRRSRWRPAGVCRLLPRRRRDPVEAAARPTRTTIRSLSMPTCWPTASTFSAWWPPIVRPTRRLPRAKGNW
jgi:hypothetical protein